MPMLNVIAVVSNPVRYASRYALYKDFESRMQANSKVRLITVELQTGSRRFVITNSGNPFHLQLRHYGPEVWHKENLINLGVQHLTKLDPTWEYVSTIDADVSFIRQDWAEETIEELQHYAIVQMWENAIFLGPTGESLNLIHSFMSQYKKGNKRRDQYGKVLPPHWHPGFAWAYRRDAWDKMGGVIDFAILGAADTHMSLAMIGAVEESINSKLSDNYKLLLRTWQQRAINHIKYNVGFVRGTLLHYWHGSMKNRFYWDRWKILTENAYDPNTDLRRDSQGVIELEIHDVRQAKLRDDIRSYFRSRGEDSIDV